MVLSPHRQFNSHCQLAYRITHRATELIQSPPTHPPVKRFTNIGAAQPELNKVNFIDHRVLAGHESGTSRCERGCTLIIASRMLTELKTAFAGVMLETSFARFMASMAAFSVEMVLPRPFGRWGPASMVKTGGDCEKATRL